MPNASDWKVTALLLGMLSLAAPAWAAPEAAIQCLTPQDMIKQAHGASIDITISLYHGGDAKIIMDALIESGGPPPFDVATVKTIGIFAYSDDSVGVLGQFFDANDCNMNVTAHMPQDAWRRIHAQLGFAA